MSNLLTCAMRTKSICQRFSTIGRIDRHITVMYEGPYPWNGLKWQPRKVGAYVIRFLLRTRTSSLALPQLHPQCVAEDSKVADPKAADDVPDP